ncbi:hypothetical protein L202_08128 [Cryptococcus amylolentus CBS 6039]|uniref:Uncharacterized protein n=1 Tax=Cryptococcus amylolentus CBS 6039 TaxID=1295533 RepID=A0A1E3H8N3_9TREE|nr:hypothetical protein L202_08128 [Cryptococcus amylolentus CBS 6039]ODN72689.1 hypothetical protein L202_08128 [Cryptococcus amylolentus CBS 6039]
MMSSASKVAHTLDILHDIFSHLSAGNDLTSLLRTSRLFFGLIAQKLHRSLPISNVLNPFSGVNAGGGGGPYGKTKLLELVQTVVVERAPLPVDHSVWADWYKLPPLPAVETVIDQAANRNALQKVVRDTNLPNNALIERLCPAATRLHLSTPCLAAGAVFGQYIPSMPCVETLVVKANVGEIGQLRCVIGGDWNLGQKARPPCRNIKAVHILLWGDLVYPEAKFQSSDRDKDCVDELAIMELPLSTTAKLEDKIFHNLCEIVGRLGTRFSVDELWLYNADTVLERLSEWSKSRKVDDMKAMMEKGFEKEKKMSAAVLGMPEEAGEAQVFWQTGQLFYEAFGDISARDETEEWYHLAVLAPSPKLVSLRARLAAKTTFPADAFVGLSEREAEWTLATFKSN